MPTPDEVLHAIGSSLLKEGCITEFQLRDDSTQGDGKVNERILAITLNGADGTEFIIESQCNHNQKILTLTDAICPEIQVDLATTFRNTKYEGHSVVPVGSAVRNIVNHYRSYLRGHRAE